MAMINCALTLEDLFPLAEAKGLSVKDVLEATLTHMVATCRESVIEKTCHKRLLELNSVAAVDAEENPIGDAIVTADKFIYELPYMISDWADSLVETGGLDMTRGFQNWAVLEVVMAEHDPEIKRSIEEREGQGRFTKH